LGLLVGTVLGEQFKEFSSADATLAGLNPGDLGAVAVEYAGGVIERVAEFLPVTAQGGADDTAPH